jgi:benzoyl-CoA reductase/2-hydroxyglutaryl-CoA dehydratase subunit BcrC/BadD/HgdB
METTEINTFVKRLNQRLEHVEQEVVDIRQQLQQVKEMTKIADGTSDTKHLSLLERSRQRKEKQRQAFAKLFEKMGIHGEPIGAENVQKMIAACGIKPEDNEFSRGIIAMREE